MKKELLDFLQILIAYRDNIKIEHKFTSYSNCGKALLSKYKTTNIQQLPPKERGWFYWHALKENYFDDWICLNNDTKYRIISNETLEYTGSKELVKNMISVLAAYLCNSPIEIRRRNDNKIEQEYIKLLGHSEKRYSWHVMDINHFTDNHGFNTDIFDYRVPVNHMPSLQELVLSRQGKFQGKL